MTTTSQQPPARRAPGALRQFHQPLRPGSPVLLVFPHAGAGASAYRALSEQFSREFTVLIMQYPGRQDRAREDAALDLRDLATEAWTEYIAHPVADSGPVTVFGHSMGGIVAFEFVRRAEESGSPAIDRLVVSATAAPSRVADLPRHPTDDEGLLAHLSVLEGTGGAVMASEAVMRMALPVLRADYTAFDRYRAARTDRVAAPVRVLGGADDPAIRPHDLHAWTAHGDDVTVTVFDGGHFYLHDNVSDVLEILTESRTAARR